ncbi:MAG: bifunctional nuclease family protein [Gemmatimonadaceae bacterium]
MIEVHVSRLGLDSATGSYVVVLQESGGTRLLPIWIGQPEAESIVRHMHNVKGPRPFTHDLVRSLIVGMGAQLRRVHITRVEKSTYYAELQIQRAETLVHIDARPSDSIAIALRLSAPIFVADELLVEPDDEEEESDDVTGSSTEPVPDADEDDPSELSADQLKSYLENLRPEDFGKFNP